MFVDNEQRAFEDIGQFISAFGTGYRFLYDEETEKPLNKELFCRKLLCEVSFNELVVIYNHGIEEVKYKRGDSTFQAYYKRGVRRRSLRPIAKDILDNGGFDTNKFKLFLEKYTLNYSKERLYDSFKKHITHTTIDSLFDDITKAFCDIIKAAANEPDRRQHSPLHDHEACLNPLEFPMAQSPNLLRERLERLLLNLEKGAIKLFSDFLVFSAEYDTASPEQREEYDKIICSDHFAFSSLNDMLVDYTIEYADFRQLGSLSRTGNSWVLSFFRPWDDSGSLEIPDGMLDYYLKLMKETKEALPNYFDHASSDDGNGCP